MTEMNRAILRAFIVMTGVIVLSSCRSPQKLLEKAIQKDPKIVSQYNDTITLTRWHIDSVMVHLGDTTIWEKIVREIQYDTIIPVKQIQIEKARTRQEVRKSHRLEMALIKMQEQESKWKYKMDQLQAKLDAKNERVEVRHKTKIVRSHSRWWLWILVGIVISILGRILIDKLWTKIWRDYD